MGDYRNMLETMRYTLLYHLLVCGICSNLIGQNLLELEAPVTKDGVELSYPWAGGLNAPQYSAVNLNEDSLVDLFVFDRSGDIILTFIQDDSTNSFRFAPEWADHFPSLGDWALLRDYNRDGVPDIFTYSSTGAPGFDVYQGSGVGENLTFVKLEFSTSLQVLTYPTSSGGRANIYVSSQDIPEVADVDFDGDLDILSFGVDGTRLSYYRNTAVEEMLPFDSLDFVREDRCWGKFTESFNTNEVLLSNDMDACATGGAPARRHSGSTTAAFDSDEDGDMEIVLGDISFDDLVLLINGGTATQAFITDQQKGFPGISNPVAIKYFPAAFFMDLDGDTVLDLIAAPSQLDARQNVDVSWLYKGRKANDRLEFDLEVKDFLANQMLDFGTDASPLFFDYNVDGLLDLLVGTRFHDNHDPDSPSTLFLLVNTGTVEQPVFHVQDTNFLQLSQHVADLDALAPTSFDIDHDGDQDLIIGNKTGKLIFVENAALPGAPFESGSIEYPWFNIDVGFSAYPTVFDVDNDSLPDLIVGEERGNINFIKNLGTHTTPSFNPDIKAAENRENFGFIDTRQNLTVFGVAAPTVLHTKDSTYLVTGTSNGQVLVHSLDKIDLNDTMQKVASPLDQLFIGRRSRTSFGNINGDGNLEVVVGNGRGGLTLFSTPFRTNPSVASEQIDRNAPIIYPNPLTTNLHIEWQSPIDVIQLFDITGQLIHVAYPISRKVSLNLPDLTPGLYLVVMQSRNAFYSRSVLKI